MANIANRNTPQRHIRHVHDGQTDQHIAERRLKAVELRKRRYSYRRIAAALNVDVSTAYRDVQAELAELRQKTQESVEELRELELAACDDVIVSMWRAAGEGDAQAARALLQASESRRRLLGLDAPTKIAPTDPTGRERYTSMTIEELEALVRAREQRVLGGGD